MKFENELGLAVYCWIGEVITLEYLVGILLTMTTYARTLGMTFGRPCSIPELYIQRVAPSQDIQILRPVSDESDFSQLDGTFYTAAMSVFYYITVFFPR